MRSSIYTRLAVTNMKNNRKTYLPYLLTAVLTVMMYYMMENISGNTQIGVEAVRTCLRLASDVMMIFAVIFLFYTNSFLIKRRKKEIGVYNILGMGKQHIARMLTVETLVTAAVSIAGGIAGGMLFERLMYLILGKLMRYDTGIKSQITAGSIVRTACLFGVIFLLTLLYNLNQIRIAKPIELLKGSESGEKEPKTKILLTILGLASLGTGYWIAVTVEKPLEALTLFFVAVVCVIAGTYLLFTAGSIALLKLLRTKKSFYYRLENFTAVSGMIYRMKQNAVGLANICILSTMVLVMVSATVSLYVGMEEILDNRFPRENTIYGYISTPEKDAEIRRAVDEETKKQQVTVKNKIEYHSGDVVALRHGTAFSLSDDSSYSAGNACEIYLIPLGEYNELEKKNVTLRPDEALVYTNGKMYGEDTISIGERTYRVAEELRSFVVEEKEKTPVVDGYYVIVPDVQTIWEILAETFSEEEQEENDYVERLRNMRYHLEFDLEGSPEARMETEKAIGARAEAEFSHILYESRELARENFYGLYGVLFFIGIYLGVMFLMATVLIIYYKQISEGYDDRRRYQIMQKVGMSGEEVRRSIKRQVRIVFFLPLAGAALHITAAFNVITKLLRMFNMTDVPLFLGCTAATVLVFAGFYVLVFSLTEKEYYKIVK